MEDSGREKLQGQSPDAVTDDAIEKVEAKAEKIDFDSAEIDKNKKVEQFENVEGAEERARAAERAKEEAKRAAEKAKEKAEKLQAKADETPLQKKARHKRNWIIALVILLILGLIGFFAFCKLKETSKTSDDYIEEVYEISSEARRILGEKKQNSFDEVDAAVSVERQTYTFKKVLTVLASDFELKDKDEARTFFNQLRQKSLDWNYVAWDSAEFKSKEKEIDELYTSKKGTVKAEAAALLKDGE